MGEIQNTPKKKNFETLTPEQRKEMAKKASITKRKNNAAGDRLKKALYNELTKNNGQTARKVIQTLVDVATDPESNHYMSAVKTILDMTGANPSIDNQQQGTTISGENVQIVFADPRSEKYSK